MKTVNFSHIIWAFVAITALCLLATILLFSRICPLLRPLPEPDGLFRVGKRSYHIKDSATKEPRQPSGHSEFMVEFYYPSDKSVPHERSPYGAGGGMSKLEAYKKLLVRNSWVPPFVWNCMFDGIQSYAKQDAPIAQERDPFPVLLFLPGIGTLPLYDSLLEELASHGYIVAEIEPPFDVELVVFPHNRVVELDPTLKKAMASTDRPTIYAYRAEAHAHWLRYLTVTLEKLSALNNDKNSLFYHKIDLNRVGVIGHSHGGGVATDFCAHNHICKAGINMDGWTKTANKIEPFSKPFLFLMSEKGIDEVAQLAALMPEYATRAELKGTEHAGFSDLAFLRQPAAWFLGMTPNSDEQVRAFQKRILAFFDAHLQATQKG